MPRHDPVPGSSARRHASWLPANGADEDGLAPEQEDDSHEEAIRHPFDPEKIRVRTLSVLVDQLMSRVKHKEIDLAPEFQRLAGIWGPLQQGRLIESLLLRIPIPVFYVAADANDTWSVVDGLQRTSTIHDYVAGKFALSGLEYLTKFSKCRYEELPRPMQRRINETQLTVNVIEPGTPDAVMFNIFRRINTGGAPLNAQEIRNALHRGVIREYLKELADSKEFRAATDESISPRRMADRECVLRFLAFYTKPWESYSSSNLDTFLGEAMEVINNMSPSQRDALASDFRKAMDAARRIFAGDAFRKRYNASDNRKPVSKSLFETWSVGLARRTDGEIRRLVEESRTLCERSMALLNNDHEFEAAISYSTAIPARIKKRFCAVDDLIRSCL